MMTLLCIQSSRYEESCTRLLDMRMFTVIEKYYLNFSTKTYIVGTQKNRFNEMVLLSTQNMFNLMGRKIISILQSLVLRNWAYVYSFFFLRISCAIINEHVLTFSCRVDKLVEIFWFKRSILFWHFNVSEPGLEISEDLLLLKYVY